MSESENILLNKLDTLFILNFNALKNVREIFITLFHLWQNIVIVIYKQKRLQLFSFDNFMETTGENVKVVLIDSPVNSAIKCLSKVLNSPS